MNFIPWLYNKQGKVSLLFPLQAPTQSWQVTQGNKCKRQEMGIACTAGSEQEQFWSGWWTELIFTTLHIHSYQYKNLLQYFSRSPFSLSLPPLSPTFPQVLPHSEFYCPTPRHPFLSFFMAHFIALSFSFSVSLSRALPLLLFLFASFAYSILGFTNLWGKVVSYSYIPKPFTKHNESA